MARKPDPLKPKLIIQYLKKNKKATMYRLGKVCDTTASTVKPILERMEKDGLLYSGEVTINGRHKIYYALNKKDLPKSKIQPKVDTQTKVIEKTREKVIVPKYYKFLDQLFGNILSSKHAEILLNHIMGLGYSLDEIEEMEREAYDMEMEKE